MKTLSQSNIPRQTHSNYTVLFQILESQLKIKAQQVEELEASKSSHLKDIDPDKEEELVAKKARVEERYVDTMFIFEN